MSMALNRRSEHGPRTNNSDSRISSIMLPEYIQHLKETTTLDQIFKEVDIRPLTPIRDTTKDALLDLSSDEEDGEQNARDDSSVAGSSSSSSSDSESSGSSSSDSSSSGSSGSISSGRDSSPESRSSRNPAQKNSLNVDNVSSRLPPLSANDSSIGSVRSTGSLLKLKISYDSNSQSPSSLSHSGHPNGLVKPVVAPASSRDPIGTPQLQNTVNNSGPSPPSGSVAISSGVAVTSLEPKPTSLGAASVANAGGIPALPPPKKAPLSPGAMSKLTGIEIKPLPKANFLKKRATADDQKIPSGKRPKPGGRNKPTSALQRAYSPERISEKKSGHTSLGEQWESELDGVSSNFELSNYVVAERLPLEKSHESTGKGLTESDSDAAEDDLLSRQSSKRARKRLKKIGEIWGSMVAGMDGPTEDYHKRGECWSRRSPPKSQRSNFSSRQREFTRGDEGVQSKDSLERDYERRRSRDRHRDRDKDRDKDKDRERDRDSRRRIKFEMKSACTQTDVANVTEKQSKGSSSDIGVQTSKTVNSSEDLFFESSSTYSDQAYYLKNHADAMPDGLMKLLCYTKSTVLLIQETYALEKEQVDVKDISAKLQQLVNFSKSYSEIITFQLSQDPERLWAILNVFTLQIQCFLYSRIFTLRRNEVTRARTKLDDLLVELAKSSYPSPTESKRSATKVSPRPPTVQESQSFQFYVKYMEMMNRCYSYTDRAENFIRKSSRVNGFYTKLRHDVGQLHLDSSLSFFLVYCTEVLRRLGYEEC